MALSDREKEQLFRLFIQQSQSPSKPKTKREPQGFFERTTLGKNLMNRGPFSLYQQAKDAREVAKQDELLMSREYQKVLRQFEKDQATGQGIYRWKNEPWFKFDLNTFEGNRDHNKLLQEAVNSEYYDGTIEFVRDYMTNTLSDEYLKSENRKFAEEKKKERSENWRKARQEAWQDAKKASSSIFNFAKRAGKKAYDRGSQYARDKTKDFKRDKSRRKYKPESEYTPRPRKEAMIISNPEDGGNIWADFEEWNKRNNRGKDFK